MCPPRRLVLDSIPEMDILFKSYIDIAGFGLSVYMENTWQAQIKNMYRNWDRLIDLIELKETYDRFRNECVQKDLPWEEYSFERGILKAQTVWKKELVESVANRIALLQFDYSPFDMKIVYLNENTSDVEIKLPQFETCDCDCYDVQ